MSNLYTALRLVRKVTRDCQGNKWGIVTNAGLYREDERTKDTVKAGRAGGTLH
jgi:hypothetical protein